MGCSGAAPPVDHRGLPWGHAERSLTRGYSGSTAQAGYETAVVKVITPRRALQFPIPTLTSFPHQIIPPTRPRPQDLPAPRAARHRESRLCTRRLGCAGAPVRASPTVLRVRLARGGRGLRRIVTVTESFRLFHAAAVGERQVGQQPPDRSWARAFKLRFSRGRESTVRTSVPRPEWHSQCATLWPGVRLMVACATLRALPGRAG